MAGALLLLPITSVAQIEGIRDSMRVGINQDTTAARADSAKKDLFKVQRWRYHAPLHAMTVESDSTLRWKVVPGWMTQKNRDPGVLTYRMGTFVRTNSMLVHAHEPRFQELYWEDVSLNDPVSGAVHWGLIPLNKVDRMYEEDKGLRYESRYYLKQYYLNKPLSQLNYTESKFDYRTLEFMVSRNFGQRTNAEISYWDRRQEGEYDNTGVSGRQIYGRIFHQLDHRQAIKLHYANSKYTVGQPFGYGIPDLRLFAFDRFAANPEQAQAETDLTDSHLALNYYRRPEDSTKVTDDLHAGLFFSNRNRLLTYSQDTTGYEIRSAGATARKWLDLGFIDLEGGASYEFFFPKNRAQSSLDYGNWNLLKLDSKAAMSPVELVELRGHAEFRMRSDGRNSYLTGLGASFNLWDRIRLSAGLSRGTKMPTMQQLYWSSAEYGGNEQLQSEQVLEGRTDVSFRFFDSFDIGIRAQLKDIQDGILLGSGGTFTNVSPYNSLSVTPYFDFNSTHFELSGSATYHKYGRFIRSDPSPFPVDNFKRVWLKGQAYVKGYLFNRATYVKAGLSGMMAPFRYRADTYNPVLDYWQPATQDQYLPVFNRLDMDISARIRGIMVVLRWENVLHGVAQRGYFETAQYPMTGRRFLFGVRALFRN